MNKLSSSCNEKRANRNLNRVLTESIGITLLQQLYAMKLVKLIGKPQQEVFDKMKQISEAITCSDRTQNGDNGGKLFNKYIKELEKQLTLDKILAQNEFNKFKVKIQLDSIRNRLTAEDPGSNEDLLTNFNEVYLNNLYNSSIEKANLYLIIEIYRSNSGTIFSKVLDKLIGAVTVNQIIEVIKRLIGY